MKKRSREDNRRLLFELVKRYLKEEITEDRYHRIRGQINISNLYEIITDEENKELSDEVTDAFMKRK